MGIFAHGFNDAYKWMASVNHSFAKNNGESFEGSQSRRESVRTKFRRKRHKGFGAVLGI